MGCIAAWGLACSFSAVVIRGDDSPSELNVGRVQRDAEKLADKFVDETRQIATLRAETEWTQHEIERLRDSTDESEFLTNLRQLKPDVRQFAERLMEKNLDPLAHGVQSMRRKGDVNVLQLQARLSDVRAQLIRGQDRLVYLDGQKRFVGQLASLVNVEKRWLWFWGVLAFGTFIALCWYDQRHALRKLTWVRRSKYWKLVVSLMCLLFVPIVPTFLGFALGNQPLEKLLSLTGKETPHSRWDEGAYEELRQQREKFEHEQQRVLEEYKRLAADRIRKSIDVFGKESSILVSWQETVAGAREAFVQSAVEASFAEALETDALELGRLRQDLKSRNEEILSLDRRNTLMGAGIGFGLLCVTFAGGAALDWSNRKRKSRIARTCPRCLTVGNLITETTTPAGVPITDPNLYEIRCTKVISESPFQECGFTFPPAYCDRNKLSFPTLGVASSGKTHWLAMTYRELNHGRHPDNVHFERVRSRGSTDFDRIIENILGSRMQPSASTLDLPHPVVFDFRDHDWPVPASVMLNVFDFAGTVTVSLGVSDSIRQRQLRSDGYLFFLDPTYPSDTQALAVIDFRDQVKLVKGLRAGQKLDAPIALCLTKIDLLNTMPFARGGDVIDRFYEDLKRIDPTGQSTSLAVLSEKSATVGTLRDSIWPNWEIEKQIRALFGDRVLFFPMTPVGMNELGETDLSKRTISPYGIVQPLLWLLHMNGYPVLDP